MNIEIIQPCNCGGKRTVKGEVVKATDRDAMYLINIGKAKETDAKPGKPKAAGKAKAPAAPAPAE